MSQQWGDPPSPSNPNPGGYNPGGYNPPPGGPMTPPPPQQPNWQSMGADKKIVAGICAIILGGFGVHKFILGYTNEGLILLGVWVAALVIAIITCGIGSFLCLIPSIIGLVEGIIYLTKSDEEFVRTYIQNKKPWF